MLNAEDLINIPQVRKWNAISIRISDQLNLHYRHIHEHAASQECVYGSLLAIIEQLDYAERLGFFKLAEGD